MNLDLSIVVALIAALVPGFIALILYGVNVYQQREDSIREAKRQAYIEILMEMIQSIMNQSTDKKSKNSASAFVILRTKVLLHGSDEVIKLYEVFASSDNKDDGKKAFDQMVLEMRKEWHKDTQLTYTDIAKISPLLA